MKIQEKIIIWTEIEVPEKLEKRALELFKLGVVTNSTQLYDALGDDSDLLKYEFLLDTEEMIKREPFSDTATLEIRMKGNSEDFLIWDNTIHIPQDFESWSMTNEGSINVELATSGADRELDFNSEYEFLKRYTKYLYSFTTESHDRT